MRVMENSENRYTGSPDRQRFMNAKEYLKQIRIYDQRIDHAISELEYLQMLSGTSQRIAYPGGTLSSADMAAGDDPFDIGEEIDKVRLLIKQYAGIREEIVRDIQCIGNRNYEELLYLKYVKCLQLTEICTTMSKTNGDGYSYDHILRMHGEALKFFWDKKYPLCQNHRNVLGCSSDS